MQPHSIGRYRILGELGRGAMGCVYLAHDPQIDRQVAVKVLLFLDTLPESDQEGARERYLREARAAGKLLHPCIVTLFDAGEADGQFYLAMEYVKGTSLDEYCTPSSRLDVDTVVSLIASAAEGLDYAHRAGIVHRDIKPANLMRVESDQVKIMDFGLARARAAETQRTRDGTLFGTPSYMSPEQIRGRSMDGRSDLFSLGVVLYEMLAGSRPFPGDTVSSIIYRIVNDPPRELDPTRADLPAALREVVQKALAKEPDERYADGAEFAAALRAAAARPAVAVADSGATESSPGKAGGSASSSAPLPDPAALPQVRRPTRRSGGSGGRLAAIVIILLVALAAAGYAFRDKLTFLTPRASPPAEVWYEATVRTEPPGLEVWMDGEPLQDSAVRYPAAEPFPVLHVESGCRALDYTLTPADAGGEVLLALEPGELQWTVEPGVDAAVAVNGERSGRAPVELTLDLCRDNEIVVEAAGFRPARLTLEARATVLQARNRLEGLTLEALPVGTLQLPETPFRVVFSVDGERVGRDVKELELEEGTHRLRMVNEAYWVDVTQEVSVVGGETVAPTPQLPALTELVVQAFPANCKVDLRVPRGSWRYLDDTPVRRRLAAGKYELRVTRNNTGETQVREIELGPGKNPDIRVSFERDS